MNYSQKRTLIGRIVYIALTLMAVTVLCITLYTFFGSKSDDPKPADSQAATTDNITSPPTTDRVPPDRPADSLPPITDDSPVVVEPAKDWTKLKVMMPVQEGMVYKLHDLTNAVYSVTMNDYRVHKGIDVETAAGEEVLSCAYGKITSIGADPFMGNTIFIDHGDGLISCYRNLADELPEGIKAGATVYAGQVIGTVGESAIIEISDEPHLHFELELNGEMIDPMSMLEYTEPDQENE